MEEVRRDPSSTPFHRMLKGIINGDKKYDQFDEADIDDLLEIKPDYDNAAYNLGLTYVKWGTQLKTEEEETEVYTDEDIEKYRQALPYLELIVESDSENAEIWELLGKVYSILSMQEEAMDAFNKADQLR